MRLSRQTLEQAEQHRPGIVHLGVGAFHRAHQAWYTNEVLEQFGGDWRIIGVSLRRPDVRDSLTPQDCLYTHVIQNGNEQHTKLIASIDSILVAPENPQAVIEAIAGNNIHVLTLTITEKAYGLDQQSGELDPTQADIAHDLSHPEHPRSALGYIAKALKQRFNTHQQALTLISCDNLSHNGNKLEKALLQFVTLQSPENSAFLGWIKENCSFPNTMVDRIVPAVGEQQVNDLAQRQSFEDRAPVFTEPFSQWVIENNFAGPVPPWNKVGAEYVKDVDAFEALKLRTLNASHSLIAYLGCLYNKQTVADAVIEPVIRKAVRALMKESEATLAMPAGFSVSDYHEALLNRFDNTALHHRCQQIAMDGSQKIPQRLVPVIEALSAEGAALHWSCLAIAMWIAYLRRTEVEKIDDPLAHSLKQQCSESTRDTVENLLQLHQIFPPGFSDMDGVKKGILFWLDQHESGTLFEAIQHA